MANQIIDKALAYLGNQFAKTSITYAGWALCAPFRSDSTNVEIMIPVTSLRMGSSYTVNTINWTLYGISNTASPVSLTVTSAERITREIMRITAPKPDTLTATQGGIAVIRGALTITAN